MLWTINIEYLNTIFIYIQYIYSILHRLNFKPAYYNSIKCNAFSDIYLGM